MADEKRGGLYKLFDVLAKIAAVAFLLALALDTITTFLYHWNVQIPAETMNTIKLVADYILLYGGLVMAGLVALEFGFKHNFIFLIIILVLLALVILPQFFPEVWKSVEQAITGQ